MVRTASRTLIATRGISSVIERAVDVCATGIFAMPASPGVECLPGATGTYRRGRTSEALVRAGTFAGVATG